MNVKHYFVTWVYMENNGAAQIGGSELLSYTGEFNLYKAHRKLQEDNKGGPVIILNWQEVSENQAQQYRYYVEDVTREKNKETAPILSIVKEDNDVP